MRINFNSQQAFRAQFDNDMQTKQILQDYAPKEPLEVYNAIQYINDVASEDTISLKHHLNCCPILNTTFHEYSAVNKKTGEMISLSSSDPIGHFNEIMRTKSLYAFKKLFSSKKTKNEFTPINDALQTNKQYANNQKKMKEIDRNIYLLSEQRDNINKRIHNLEHQKFTLQNETKETIKEYVASLIDETI